MNKDELIKQLEDLETPKVEHPNHQKKLKMALLNSDHFNRRGFWERTSKYMNMKKVLQVGIALVAVLAIIRVFTLNNDGTNQVVRDLSPKRVMAQELVNEAINKLDQLSTEQKLSLEHDLGEDLSKVLNEAYNAQDLTYNDLYVASNNKTIKRIGFTNSKGEKIAIDLDDESIIYSVSKGNLNISVEEWLKISQEESIAKYKAEREQQDQIYVDAEKQRLPQLREDTAKLLEEANASVDLKFIKEGKISSGKILKFYSYTDKYNRKVTYGIGIDGIIWETTVEDPNKGKTEITKDVISNIPSGWKLYSNDYGYEIAYPANWFDADYTQGSNSLLSEYYITKNLPDYNNGYLLQIIVYKGKFSDITQSWSDDTKNEIKDVIFNGYKAKKSFLDENNYSIYIEKNNKVYVLHFSYDNSLEIAKEVAEKVLSTFEIK